MNDLNYNPLRDVANRQPARPATGLPSRRTIGPIPPRDKTGRLCLVPQIGKRLKVDEFGEPVADENGRNVWEMGDTRDPREYAAYEAGQKPAPEAIKGLRLFKVDMPPEAFALVYAKSADHAVDVYKAEFGITRFGEYDPKAEEVAS